MTSRRTWTPDLPLVEVLLLLERHEKTCWVHLENDAERARLYLARGQIAWACHTRPDRLRLGDALCQLGGTRPETVQKALAWQRSRPLDARPLGQLLAAEHGVSPARVQQALALCVAEAAAEALEISEARVTVVTSGDPPPYPEPYPAITPHVVIAIARARAQDAERRLAAGLLPLRATTRLVASPGARGGSLPPTLRPVIDAFSQPRTVRSFASQVGRPEQRCLADLDGGIRQGVLQVLPAPPPSVAGLSAAVERFLTDVAANARERSRSGSRPDVLRATLSWLGAQVDALNRLYQEQTPRHVVQRQLLAQALHALTADPVTARAWGTTVFPLRRTAAELREAGQLLDGTAEGVLRLDDVWHALHYLRDPDERRRFGAAAVEALLVLGVILFRATTAQLDNPIERWDAEQRFGRVVHEAVAAAVLDPG